MIEDQLTPEKAERHNRLYRQGWALAEQEFLVGDRSIRPRSAPGWFARRRLRQAIQHFEAALTIAPANWSALWALGKIHQRLGAVEQALACFSQTHAINPLQADVAREAGLCAGDLGRASEAVRFTRIAIDLEPSDAGLLANLALALLISGDVRGAQVAADEACARAPDDAVSENVQRIVEEVVGGKRPLPLTIGEVAPAG